MNRLHRLHFGIVDEDAKLTLENRPLFKRQLKALAGQKVEIVIRKRRSQRSLDQNRWLWGVALRLLVEDFGYERHEWKEASEDLHYQLLERCFGMHWDPRLQRNVPNARSSKLTTKQFSEYMEWLVRYAAKEYGVIVPLPNEVDLSQIEDDAA